MVVIMKRIYGEHRKTTRWYYKEKLTYFEVCAALQHNCRGVHSLSSYKYGFTGVGRRIFEILRKTFLQKIPVPPLPTIRVEFLDFRISPIFFDFNKGND